MVLTEEDRVGLLALVRQSGEDLELDTAVAFHLLSFVAAAFHAAVIAFSGDHPLNPLLPFAGVIALWPVHKVGLLAARSVSDYWGVSPRRSRPRRAPRHEQRIMLQRAMRHLAVAALVYALALCLSVELCVHQEFAAPHSAWSEAVFWVFGTHLTGLGFAAIVLGLTLVISIIWRLEVFLPRRERDPNLRV